MKKPTRRSKVKYAGLDKSVNLKIRHEIMDFDYLDKLSDDDKKWLSNFMREYASADFTHKGKKLHRTKKKIKAVYDANNARNRDAFGVTKSNGMLKGLSVRKKDKDGNEMGEMGVSGAKSTVPNEVEDTIITVLDHFNEKK